MTDAGLARIHRFLVTLMESDDGETHFAFCISCHAPIITRHLPDCEWAALVDMTRPCPAS